MLGTGMHGAVLVAKHRKSGRRVAAKCLEGENGLPEDLVMLNVMVYSFIIPFIIYCY